MEPTSSMEQQFLKKLTDIIDANLHKEQFGVNELAEELGMSRITLHRKVKSIIKKSVSEFIRETRLKRANDLLQQKTGTISEIAYKVGFGSVTYFDYSFRKYYGYPPGEVLKGMHPDVEKTPVKNKQSLIQKLRKSKILYVIPVAILLVVVVVLFIKNQNGNNQIKKSVVVLPPLDNSTENGKEYILEDFWEEAQVELTNIKDLSVVSIRSAENYRNSKKGLKKIAKELKVDYVIDIRGQTNEGKTIIRIQLIEAASGKSPWSKEYSFELDKENIYENHRDFAQSVASALQIQITPEEKLQIDKVPSQNQGAQNCYFHGLEELGLYRFDFKSEHLVNAKQLLLKAIELDPLYANAYLKLAEIYYEYMSMMYYGNWEQYDNSLDSGKLMLEKALDLDVADKNKANLLLSDYLLRSGEDNFKQSISTFEKGWENKLKDYNYYFEKGKLYHSTCDYYNSLKYFFSYLELLPKTELTSVEGLGLICENLMVNGFPELAKKYLKQITNQLHEEDPLKFYMNVFLIDINNKNYKLAKETLDKWLSDIPSDKPVNRYLFYYYVAIEENDKAYEQLQKVTDLMNTSKQKIEPDLFMGYIYLLKGDKEKANWHFSGEIENIGIQPELRIPYAHQPDIFFRLITIYSLTGEMGKALYYLRLLSERETVPIFSVDDFKMFPFYDNIKDEPEFKKTLKVLEEKYLRERERVKKLLISKGLVPL